jgi:hypothetical protein
MSDKPPPPKPSGPRLSHLQSEPLSFSVASPQQIAQYMAAANSGYHPRPQFKTTSQMSSQMPTHMMSTMHTVDEAPHHKQPVPSIPASAAAAATEAPSKLKPLPPQPIDVDTFRGFTYVSNDALQMETRQVYDDISETFQWVYCSGQEDRCIQCIRDECVNKRVFLITTGSVGQSVIPKIHDLPQLYAVYIYCVNVKFHQTWAKDYSKIRVVCDNDDRDLLPRFALDVAQSNIDLGNGYLAKGKRNEAKACFEKAEQKLNVHVRNYGHDPAMDIEIKSKLAECK